MNLKKENNDFIENNGRPPIFETADQLIEKIHEYFNSGVRKRSIRIGAGPTSKIIEMPIPTISGLCLFLGFSSRQSFYDYEKKDGFSYTIKRARLFIETEYEEQLQVGNTTGAIFALKNLGWQDKTEVVNKNLNSRELSDEEIVELNEKLDKEF